MATTTLRWTDELQIDQAQLSRRQKSEKRWISMSRYISRGFWLPQAPWVGKQGTAAPPQKSNAPQMTPQPRSAFGIKLASLCSLVSLLSSFNSSTGFTSFSFRYTSSLVLHQCSKTFRLCSVIAVTVVVTHVIKIEIKMNLTRASGSSSDIVICFYFTA